MIQVEKEKVDFSVFSNDMHVSIRNENRKLLCEIIGTGNSWQSYRKNKSMKKIKTHE